MTVHGQIVDVRPRSLTQTDSILLRTDAGTMLELKASESLEFTPGHLREHMVFGQPVTVTYVEKPDGPLAVRNAEV
jgi:hypothetical protein